MKKIWKELRTWNWEAIGALILCWAIVFYEVLK